MQDVFKANPTLPIATASTKAPMILLDLYVELSVASVGVIIGSVHVVCTRIFPAQFLITATSSLGVWDAIPETGDISQLTHLRFRDACGLSNVTTQLRRNRAENSVLLRPCLIRPFPICHPASLRTWLPLARFQMLWHAQLGT